MEKQLTSALLGLAVGDALGVPVEFSLRSILDMTPVTDMRAYGEYQQPAGTWSDDTSLTLCLAHSLSFGYNITEIAKSFVKWYDHAFWTAHDQVFDKGIATSAAIQKIRINPANQPTGGTDEYSNGNGSLMRVLPLAFYFKAKNTPIEKRFEMTKEVSSITHAHIRSVLSCFIYLEYALLIMNGIEKKVAYQQMQNDVSDFFQSQYISSQELIHFKRIFNKDITQIERQDIRSDGYVVHSLEATFYTLLRNTSYRATVLEAVNLGDDTDTTAAIVGGLAGILYGLSEIPEIWLSQLARTKDIKQLAEQLARNLNNS